MSLVFLCSITKLSGPNVVSFTVFNNKAQQSLPVSDEAISDSLKPNLARANWTGLCDYLNSVNSVNELSSFMSVSSMWDTFIRFVTIGVNACAVTQEWCFCTRSY